MTSGRRVGLALVAALAVLVTACGGSSTPTTAPSSTGPGISTVPGGNGGDFAQSAKLEATLPDSVGGVALQKGSLNVLQFYTGGNSAANILTLFIAGLGVTPAQVGVAAAVDPDGKIQILAAEFTGVTSEAIQAQVETVAKGIDPNVTLANTTIGGKPVTTATYPNSKTGPAIAYVTGDTLYLVQSSDPALAEDALKQLP
jgi:hypothetical protein